jgi:hypothetical protein
MNPQTGDLIAWLACGLLAAATMVFIFLPSKNTERGADKTRVAYLYERKEVVYENLRDLNFEFKSGKFTQDDFDRMRLSMEAEAARILAEIDQLESIQA